MSGNRGGSLVNASASSLHVMVVLNLPTLFAITVFILAMAGLMLLFSWVQNRSVQALGLWGGGLLLASFAMTLLAAREVIPNVWSIQIGNALMSIAYALMWNGARSFEGRSTPVWWLLVGAVIWLAACQVDAFLVSTQARIVLASTIMGTYTVLGAVEFWRGRETKLMSRWPLIVLMLGHSGLMFVRIAFSSVLPFPMGGDTTFANWAYYSVFSTLFYVFCMAFLLVNMAKERQELRHRQAAMVDPLTGAPNRRAFLSRGEELLRRMRDEGRGAALLLLDLDEFKRINDTFGHQTGDRVLTAFCETATRAIGPEDLFGRLGGEEFACLLPGQSLTQAMQSAERIRQAFEATLIDVDGTRIGATVSVGVATASDLEPDLPALFAAADRALYRAKAKGRNRVEPVRALALVEPSTPAVKQRAC